MSVTQAEQDLLHLLSSVSERELREACIDSMRGHVGRSNPHLHVSDFIGGLLDRLVQLQPRAVTSPVSAMAGILTHCQQQRRREVGRLAEFMWWLVRAGLGIPRISPDGWDAPSVLLTDAGWEFVETRDAHPLLPGAVARLEAACPGLPAHVVELLADAVECCSFGLNRAAVALLGFAYEGTIDAVLDHLVTKGRVTKSKLPFHAGDRLDLLRKTIPAVYPDSARKEARGNAEFACDLADKIRDTRNRASHPKLASGMLNRDYVEEYIVSGFRRLPDLWAVGQA